MRRLRKHITSILFIVAPFLGYSQDLLKQDSLAHDSLIQESLAQDSLAQDSLKIIKRKISLTLYGDVGKGIESAFGKQIKWEFGIGLLVLENYHFVIEYGFGRLNPESVINNGSYTSEGNYYRFGFEYVFTISPKRYLSTGIMYAQSNFFDYGTVLIESDLWDDINETFERSDLSANWLELIVNTEAPLVKVEEGFFSNFYWGLRLRLRILTSDIAQPDFDIFAIPGYGKTYSRVVPAVNLYLKYRIDF